MDTILPSQPSSYGQLLKTSLKLYRASFLRIILLSLLLSITVFVPRLFSILIGQDIFSNLSEFSPHRLWMLAVDLVAILFFIGIIWRMNCVIYGSHEPIIEDLTIGVKKLIYVLVASIIQSSILFGVLVIGLGLQILLHQHQLLFNTHPIGILFTVFIFLGQFILILYISTLFIFYIPLIAIENRGVIGSIEYSVLMVWNHWWRVLSVQITPWLCYVLLLFFIRYALKIDIHIYFAGYNTNSIGSTMIQLIVFAIYIPWIAAILLVQLKDIELKALRKKMTTTSIS